MSGKKPRARLEITEHGCSMLHFVCGWDDTTQEQSFDRIPERYEKAVALLLLCDDQTEIPRVGYRVSSTVFYVEE
jgi:hypothetical protein